jgi:CcmD family protein
LQYLFLGYAIIWIAIFFYIMGLHRRQRELERDIELLRSTLARRDE